jgi:hypothetical protein
MELELEFVCTYARPRHSTSVTLIEIPPNMADPLTLDEVEAAAKKSLPRKIYDFYASGADGQRAVARNRYAFSRYTDLRKKEENICKTNMSTVDSSSDLECCKMYLTLIQP